MGTIFSANSVVLTVVLTVLIIVQMGHILSFSPGIDLNILQSLGMEGLIQSLIQWFLDFSVVLQSISVGSHFLQLITRKK